MSTEPYVTPGHPVQSGAGYDCNCGQCLEVRALLVRAQETAWDEGHESGRNDEWCLDDNPYSANLAT